MTRPTILGQLVLAAAAVVMTGSVFGATRVSLSRAIYSVRENSTNATISVLRAGNPHGKLTVNYATSNGTAIAGSDYTASSGTLTFNSGQRLKTFTVPILNDLLIETNETINLALSNPSGGAQLRAPTTAVLTIIDDDGNPIPNISIDNVTANEGNTGTTPFVFHVNLAPTSTATVAVSYATSDGSAVAGADYVAQNGTLVFNPGESAKIITVIVNTDTVNEPDKIFFVDLTPVSTNVTVAPAQGIGTIINDDGPIVVDDSYSTPENTPLTVPAPGVLANDSDVAGNPFTAEVVSDPAHGKLTLNADGSFTYTPNANFIGADTFEYQSYDGVADSEIATVTITVPHVNRPPVANPDSFGTPPDTALNVAAPGVLANDTDFENDAITAVLVTNPVHGSVSLNPDGALEYTPAAGFSGLDTFTYLANDGQSNSAPATVVIYVDANNRVPVANPDSYTTPADTPRNIPAPGVLANDTDADTNTLTAVLFTDVSHGTLTLNANGSFNYTPAAGYNGPDSFTYRANDGIATSSVATVAIAVGAFNTAPIAGNDSFTVAEDDVLTGDILANDTDPQNDPLTAALVAGPAHGTLTLHADGAFTYVPDDNFNGTDTFTYRATDGALASNLATVTITVTPVNGAGDVDLYAKSAALLINWATPKSDRCKITGQINPRGAKANPAGATLQLSLNGTPVAAPVTLDSRGNATGSTTKARFSSATGRYSFSVTGADLRTASGLTNLTNSGTVALHVTLAIQGAGLDLPVVSADLVLPVTTTAGKASTGKFAFKTHPTLSGVFNWNKTTATQLKDGKFKLAAVGVLEAPGGQALKAAGPPRVRVGDDVLALPASNVVWTVSDVGHKFKLTASELEATGIPIAGTAALTTCLLPVLVEVPTPSGTNTFETIIELKRPDGTSLKWQR